jgi:hypothetical protein
MFYIVLLCNERVTRGVLSSGMLCLVVRLKFTDVSEEYTSSILKVEEYASDCVLILAVCLLGLLIGYEDGNIRQWTSSGPHGVTYQKIVGTLHSCHIQRKIFPDAKYELDNNNTSLCYVDFWTSLRRFLHKQVNIHTVILCIVTGADIARTYCQR